MSTPQGQWFFACALLVAGLSSAPAARAQDVLGEVGISGAGSTLIYPLLSKWSHEYRDYRASGGEFPAPNSGLEDPLPSSVLEYEPVGSLAGTLRLKERAVDFAASDMPYTQDELTRFELEQFPIVIGAVVAAVNLDGIGSSELRLTGPLLAEIYLGNVKRWSDPAIRALNPSLSLPDAAITVIHRSDGSGTTFNFTEYLSRVSPAWKRAVSSGLLVAWPLGHGVKGNEGVARALKAQRNAIGYLDFAQAKQVGLPCASIRNRDGVFVRPSAASFKAAAASVDWTKQNDFNVLLLDAPGRDAYPIPATVFALLHRKASRSKTAATLEFFRWSIEHGSTTAAGLGYVPLPPLLANRVKEHWNKW